MRYQYSTKKGNNQQPTKTLSSIAITTEPTTREYEVGETAEIKTITIQKINWGYLNLLYYITLLGILQ